MNIRKHLAAALAIALSPGPGIAVFESQRHRRPVIKGPMTERETLKIKAAEDKRQRKAAKLKQSHNNRK